ncbi:hypothetical protein [Streptomyces sp. NBC_01361]|uniref:hypothetical protein n=1 Tax=Streptomyces sp. NBC_01361 TaxID=2903838 RepID=UPI002E377C22|nr:hypothetical protein [Streptomyces sp. NBC_01361]
MSIGYDYTLTGAELEDIFNVRLRPYLPTYLIKVDPQTHSIRYTFTPFTGQEDEPTTPRRYSEDPKLAYQHLDEKARRSIATEAEYELREAARFLLDDIYRAARIEWKNARYIAALKAAVKNAGDLWKAHNQAKRAAEAAFSYLREPDAAKEWTAAVSRLVDAHDTYMKAAVAFDERARDIAEVHDQNLYEESPSYKEAYASAGFPEAWDWPIAELGDYGLNYRGEYREDTLAGRAQALIKEQEAHVAKVGRLSGATGDA